MGRGPGGGAPCRGGADACSSGCRPRSGGTSPRRLLEATRERGARMQVRLTDRAQVTRAELADEPFVALPRSTGVLREFWLATEERASPARVAVEADTAEGAIEAVASGAGVVLLAEGNARLLARPDVVCRPVPDLGPCELAVAWRRGDTRELVAAAVAGPAGWGSTDGGAG